MLWSPSSKGYGRVNPRAGVNIIVCWKTGSLWSVNNRWGRGKEIRTSKGGQLWSGNVRSQCYIITGTSKETVLDSTTIGANVNITWKNAATIGVSKVLTVYNIKSNFKEIHSLEVSMELSGIDSIKHIAQLFPIRPWEKHFFGFVKLVICFFSTLSVLADYNHLAQNYYYRYIVHHLWMSDVIPSWLLHDKTK